MLNCESHWAKKKPYRLSYMTTSPGWTADYALYLARNERRVLIKDCATVLPLTGLNIKNAKIRLVFGSSNQVSSQPMPRQKAMAHSRTMAFKEVMGAEGRALLQ